MIRRREFISLLGGAAAAWPLRARAQQTERVRRIGILLPAAADDAEYQARVGAFLQGLQQSGWTIGRNLRIDTRWATANADAIRRHAAELAALAPDVMLAHGGLTVGAMQQATRTVPIVFPVFVDPVGAGVVESLARPGGNATGFMSYEYSLSGKWLELLKQIAPNVTRAAVLRNPAFASGLAQFGAVQAVAPSLRVDVNPVSVRDAGEIERAVAAFAGAPNGGLIVLASTLANSHRELIVTLAARHKLPTVYFERSFVTFGGLISYGPDFVDQYRQAAGYVDRILKGEKPADLPVQAPTKYELVINLKTAKALGLTVPQALLATRRRGDRMKRRQFITLLGGAAATWPLAARAQQTMPVIGFIYTGPQFAPFVPAFQRGLRDTGFVEGQNVAVEYRFADDQQEQLRAIVAELMHRQIAVIVGNTPPAMAAKSASSTVPIVFVTGGDPVELGLVRSFNRPGGNATGVSFLTVALEAKRQGLLLELLPQTRAIAALVDPNAPDSATQLKNVQDAARTFGREIQIVQASTASQLDNGFATLASQRADALIVVPTPFFTRQRTRIAELAARYALPAIYGLREYAAAGGLMSYGASLTDAFQQAGGYAGRILKGEKPADLPVLQPTKFDLVINLTTAKALGLEIPAKLLALADEVIE